MRVTVVVQARLGSTRLPGKALLPVGDLPLLGHVLRQCLAASRADGVVLATTELPEDDALAALAGDMHVPVFRGSRDDVLGRFLGAADMAGADLVVRVTGDCPFVCPDLIDRAVEMAVREQAEAVGAAGYPEGVTAEVVSRGALGRTADLARAKEDREHVTSYLWRNPSRFRTRVLECPEPLGEFAFSVDDEEDLAFARAVWGRVGRPGAAVRFPELAAVLEDPDIADTSRRLWRKKEGTPSGGVVRVPEETA